MSGDWPGRPGIRWTRDGAYFSVFSDRAERLELCLFDAHGRESERLEMHPGADGLWTVYLPACRHGQLYGYRADGPFAPEQGLRFNPAKLLIDPYARALQGQFNWSPAVFDYLPGQSSWQINPQDSAPFVPRCVALGLADAPAFARPRVAWSDLVIYEANVRGFTMRHPALSDEERGRFHGLANGRIVEYLVSLGITAVELMPVQSFIDEQFLVQRGLRNAWGYNTLNFFAPEARYAGEDAIAEFHDMVRSLHDAGIEVILDVAFNHTAEGDVRGPSLSLRGLDHLAYYRVAANDPERCINDTGTGNTINADQPRVQELITEALCYWHREMGVDGFRFDLATVLGRRANGFDPGHPLLAKIGSEPRLKGVRLVAEPWDPGPGGYQLGQFPEGWSEWNDRCRDGLRRFWRGDPQQACELASRMSGSPDVFPGRGAQASINFITAHDGFTLFDLVSYRQRHNQANGEDNRDGHSGNFSCNHGVEGQTDDKAITASRRRHRLNLLASLLFSHGIPMLLAGDEFGNSQAGNNNAYAQDNETGWLDWNGLESDPAFTCRAGELIALRKRLRFSAAAPGMDSAGGLGWLNADGENIPQNQWNTLQTLQMTNLAGDGKVTAIIVINGADSDARFSLTAGLEQGLQLVFSSDDHAAYDGGDHFTAPAWSITCLASSAH